MSVRVRAAAPQEFDRVADLVELAGTTACRPAWADPDHPMKSRPWSTASRCPPEVGTQRRNKDQAPNKDGIGPGVLFWRRCPYSVVDRVTVELGFDAYSAGSVWPST